MTTNTNRKWNLYYRNIETNSAWFDEALKYMSVSGSDDKYEKRFTSRTNSFAQSNQNSKKRYSYSGISLRQKLYIMNMVI